MGIRHMVMLVCSTVLICGMADAKPDYKFDGSISRKVLENYLSRAVTINGLSFSPQRDDDIRMMRNIGAKFLGRVAYLWGQPPADEEAYWKEVKLVADRLHKDDPERILQACVFEAIYTGIDRVPIPAWVFKEFGLQPEKRNFSYKAMLYDNGVMHNLWGPEGSVPDISKMESKMWFFYRAKRYIDAGYEGIHFGQIQLIGNTDPGYKNWLDIIRRVRAHAKKHARRHYVLLDAHVVTSGNLPIVNGWLLLDFFSFPQRPKEVPGEPQKAVLEMGHADSMYGKSSGGIHPSGWKCDHIPYIVEFDNCFPSGKEGQPGAGIPFVWGYEEVTWFANQSEEYRNEWLRYAWNWIRKNDPNGYLQMPGSIPMAIQIGDATWYRANTRSKASPTSGSQEETIKAIWAGK
ncbi:MAG: hypothetical protein ACYC27_09820 [Armatimonadota bacterium]